MVNCKGYIKNFASLHSIVVNLIRILKILKKEFPGSFRDPGDYCKKIKLKDRQRVKN